MTHLSQSRFHKELLQYIDKQKHVMFLYDDMADYRDVATCFVLDGLACGDRCIMATDEYLPEQIADDFASRGKNMQSFIDTGQLVLIDVAGQYRRGEAFDPEKTMAQWQDITRLAEKDGFQHVRAVGEATFGIGDKGLGGKLVYYENIINRDLFHKYPFLSLCVYNKQLYPPEVIKAAIKAHPMLVYGRKIYKHNIYYVPPEIALSREPDLNELETWLGNMEASNGIVQALTRSEEKFKRIFQSANDAFYLHEFKNGMPGNYVEMNEVACQMLGYSEEEFLKMSHRDIDMNRALDASEVVNTIRTKGSAKFESVHKAKDGQLIPVEVSAHLLSLDDKTFAFSVVRDISEQKRSEEALRSREAELTSVIRAAPVGIGVVVNRVFTRVNARMCEMTGYDRESLLNKNTSIVYPSIDEYQQAGDDKYKQIIQSGTGTVETRWQRKDGGVIDVLLSSTPMVPGDLSAGVTFTALDITDRKQAEDRLKLSEERFKLAMDANDDGLWDWDIPSGKVYYSPGYAAMLGYESTQIPAHVSAWTDLIHPDDKEAAVKANMDCIHNKREHFSVEFRMQAKDGQWRWVLGRGKAVNRDENGHALRLIGTHTDITERKRTQRELTDSEARFRQIYDSMAVGVARVSLEFQIKGANEAYCRMLGYDESELIGKTLREISHPETVEENLLKQEQLARGEIDHFRMEKRFIHKTGGVVHGILDANLIRTADGAPAYFLGSVLDISKRKRAELMLHSITCGTARATGKAFFHSLVSHLAHSFNVRHAFVGELIKGTEQVRTLAVWNGRPVDNFTYELKGSVCEQVMGKKTCVFPKDVQQLFPEDKALADMGAESYFGTPMFNLSGEPIGILVILDDKPIDTPDDQASELLLVFAARASAELERIRAEEELIRHQQSISLNNQIANVFLTASPEDLYDHVLGVILEELNSGVGFFGYIDDVGDLVCPSMVRGLYKDGRRQHESMTLAKSSWGGLWGKSLKSCETYIVNQDLQLPKDHIPLGNAMAVPILHRNNLIGQIVLGNRPGGYGPFEQELLENAALQTAPVLNALIEKDKQLKAHNKLESQYRQAVKIEAIGRLAGGVAHDLNNMLSPILGYGEMLLDDTAPHDPRRESLQEIVKASIRARDLVRQLLAFSRKQTLEFSQVELNSLLHNFYKLIRRTIREDIVIDLALSGELPYIKGDVGQIEQIIMNLAINAQDAMPDGGRLTIATTEVELHEQDALNREGVMPGPYIMVSVQDTGHGMTPDVQEHIFEPFFTTKEMDKGTGLGLATVYGIVKQHEGHIWVYSEPDMGTTLKLYFPVAMPHQAADDFQEMPQLSELKGSETILLVEDDRTVRDLALHVLKRKGYHILTAESGDRAMAILKDHDAHIHLLLTDVVMPGMNGKELYEQVSAAYPDIKVLYMSGYTDDVIAHRGVMDAGVQLIEKPFSVKALAGRVRDVLDHP